MSLRRIEKVSTNVINLIVYVQSPSLEYYVKNKLKERFDVHRDFIVTPRNAKEIEDAKLDAYISPLLCDKWLIHIEADSLSRKDIDQSLRNNPAHGVTVYWTSKYRTFMQLQDSEIVKKQGVHCQIFSFSRLTREDLLYLHNNMLPKEKHLNEELRNYVCKNYTYDVQSACDLFALIRSGNEVKTKKDIIEAVGLGGNSTSSLVIRILKSNPKTAKSRATAVGRIMRLVDDLSTTYNHSSIYRFMVSDLQGFIDMKQLQIAGIYNRINKEIPDAYDTKRLSRLRRFERIILNEVTLPELLNLKLCLTHYNSFNHEVAIIQAITEYFNNLKLEEDE